MNAPLNFGNSSNKLPREFKKKWLWHLFWESHYLMYVLLFCHFGSIEFFPDFLFWFYVPSIWVSLLSSCMVWIKYVVDTCCLLLETNRSYSGFQLLISIFLRVVGYWIRKMLHKIVLTSASALPVHVPLHCKKPVLIFVIDWSVNSNHQLKETHESELLHLHHEHQLEVESLRHQLESNEDDSIIDLATRVRARLDANDEMDRRILERLSSSNQSQLANGHVPPGANGEASGKLQVII